MKLSLQIQLNILHQFAVKVQLLYRPGTLQKTKRFYESDMWNHLDLRLCLGCPTSKSRARGGDSQRQVTCTMYNDTMVQWYSGAMAVQWYQLQWGYGASKNARSMRPVNPWYKEAIVLSTFAVLLRILTLPTLTGRQTILFVYRLHLFRSLVISFFQVLLSLI